MQSTLSEIMPEHYEKKVMGALDQNIGYFDKTFLSISS
jgi:hypothetical protein